MRKLLLQTVRLLVYLPKVLLAPSDYSVKRKWFLCCHNLFPPKRILRKPFKKGDSCSEEDFSVSGVFIPHNPLINLCIKSK